MDLHPSIIFPLLPYSFASSHEGNTATTTTASTAATATTTGATSATATTTAATTATTVFLAWSAGYSATAAAHNATSVTCFIGPCADEPSVANAAEFSNPIPAEPGK